MCKRREAIFAKRFSERVVVHCCGEFSMDIGENEEGEVHLMDNQMSRSGPKRILLRRPVSAMVTLSDMIYIEGSTNSRHATRGFMKVRYV